MQHLVLNNHMYVYIYLFINHGLITYVVGHLLCILSKTTLLPLDRIMCYNYCICGLFGGDFNLAVWQIFITSPNLNHAFLTRTHKIN